MIFTWKSVIVYMWMLVGIFYLIFFLFFFWSAWWTLESSGKSNFNWEKVSIELSVGNSVGNFFVNDCCYWSSQPLCIAAPLDRWPYVVWDKTWASHAELAIKQHSSLNCKSFCFQAPECLSSLSYMLDCGLDE